MGCVATSHVPVTYHMFTLSLMACIDYRIEVHIRHKQGPRSHTPTQPRHCVLNSTHHCFYFTIFRSSSIMKSMNHISLIVGAILGSCGRYRAGTEAQAARAVPQAQQVEV